jgi:hypothetical protein
MIYYFKVNTDYKYFIAHNYKIFSLCSLKRLPHRHVGDINGTHNVSRTNFYKLVGTMRHFGEGRQSSV